VITLREMLEGFDPAGGRPLDVTRIYMANVIGADEGARLLKRQKLDEYRARKRAKEDLRMDIAAIARGEKPSWRYAKSVPTPAGQLGQQAIGFPPLEGGDGAGGGVPAAKNT
jgi:hypothetical protein